MELHKTDQEIFDDNFDSLEERIGKWLVKIERKNSVSGLDRIRNMSYEYVLYACSKATHEVTDANVEEIESIYRSLYLYLQCSSNLFALSKSGNSEEALSVDDMEIDFVTEGYQGYVGINKWRDLFMAALIGREKNVLHQLRNISVDDLRSDGGIADDYYYTYVQFLQALGTAEAPGLLQNSQDQLKAARIVSQEYKECLLEPVLNLWQAVINNNSAELNTLLEDGVIKFRSYWSQKKDDNGGDSYRCNYPEGFLAMNLTAIAAYAHDQGLQVTYTSDFLPRFFIEGYMKVDAKVTMA